MLNVSGHSLNQNQNTLLTPLRKFGFSPILQQGEKGFTDSTVLKSKINVDTKINLKINSMRSLCAFFRVQFK